MGGKCWKRRRKVHRLGLNVVVLAGEAVVSVAQATPLHFAIFNPQKEFDAIPSGSRNSGPQH